MIAIAITESNVMLGRRRFFACRSFGCDLVLCFNRQMPNTELIKGLRAVSTKWFNKRRKLYQESPGLTNTKYKAKTFSRIIKLHQLKFYLAFRYRSIFKPFFISGKKKNNKI